MNSLQVRAGQVIQSQRDAGMILHLLFADDQSLAGAAREQRHLGMDPDDFENLSGMRKEARRQKDQAERRRTASQSPTQVLGPFLQARFIKIGLPMSSHGKFRTHPRNLRSGAQFATLSTNSKIPVSGLIRPRNR